MTPDEKLDTYAQKLTLRFEPKVFGCFQQISGPRSLLALWGYVRHPDKIRHGWAWTKDDETKFKNKPEYREMLNAIKEVQSQFAVIRITTGEQLRTNKKFRTLAQQIDAWKKNPGVPDLNARLRQLVSREIIRYPDDPDESSLEAFRRFLCSIKPPDIGGSPTNATPGLSEHGHLTAFDFVVTANGEVVAGTNTNREYIRQKWEGPGRTDALKKAVGRANDVLKHGHFKGPLKSPYEPWHYTYEV